MGVCMHMDWVKCPNCFTAPPLAPPPQHGWVCPVCGTANAPWVRSCSHGTSWTSNDITVNITATPPTIEND